MWDLLIELSRTTGAVLAAIAAFLTSIVIIFDKIEQLYRIIIRIFGIIFKRGQHMELPDSSKVKEKLKMESNGSKSFHIRILFSLLLVIFGAGIFIVRASNPIPLSVKLTNEAWTAYDKKEYEKAIEKAKKCIEEFSHMANELQSELEGNNEPLPSGGKVNKEEKEEIHSRGLLNDVATCWHIIGRSYERLKNKQKAIEAYCKALKYTYALTYDPSWDGFWSPSKDAKAKLEILEGNCEEINN